MITFESATSLLNSLSLSIASWERDVMKTITFPSTTNSLRERVRETVFQESNTETSFLSFSPKFST